MTDTEYYVLFGAAVLVVLVASAVYWYCTQWAPFLHPPPVIKDISTMFEQIVPGGGKIPIKEGDESYTMNKNNITLCTKDPRTGKQYSWNTLSYVSLHELSHILTKIKEKDPHGPIFKRNFKKLLNRAEQLGYYNPNIVVPDTYCKT